MSTLKRFTPEQIQSKALDHVGYGWSARPGTHSSEYTWTEEDTALYMKYYREALEEKRIAEGKPLPPEC
jgi:hypothetical protein